MGTVTTAILGKEPLPSSRIPCHLLSNFLSAGPLADSQPKGWKFLSKGFRVLEFSTAGTGAEYAPSGHLNFYDEFLMPTVGTVEWRSGAPRSSPVHGPANYNPYTCLQPPIACSLVLGTPMIQVGITKKKCR